METILVSACLLGENCKYDGGNNYLKKSEELKSLCDIILICPETFGGLKTPRLPSEIKNGRVINSKNKDITNNFYDGAYMTIAIAKENHVRYALLKERSPSCGVHQIYDGTFTSKKIEGMGITSKLLKENNIKVFSEDEIDELILILKNSI